MPKHPGKGCYLEAWSHNVCAACALTAYGFGTEPPSSSLTHQLGICPELYNILGSVALDEPRHNGEPGMFLYIQVGSNRSSAHQSAILKVCLHGNTLTSCIIQHLLVGKVGRELEFQMPGVTVQGGISWMPRCKVCRRGRQCLVCLSYYSMYIYCITLTVSLFLLLCWSFMIFEHPDSNI